MARHGLYLKILAAAAALACLVTWPARMVLADGQFSPAQKGEIEQIIKSYILKNPEILRDAISELELREKTAEADAQKKIISNLKGPLYVSDSQEVVGNPNGKVTLIEFFDYNCGYCKKSLPDLASLIKEMPDLRVILKDYPILSERSIEAAEIAIALRKQFSNDKFWDYHQKLLSSHVPVGRPEALALAKAMGADMDRLTKDAGAAEVKKGLEANDQLGRALMLTGTPSFIIGDETVVGAVGYASLKGKLDNVRKCGKAACS
jgi:protein-disulfide isomerase